VLVVVAYGLILPPEVLRLPRLGCVNIHASLLPRWRGAAPIQRAILAGDTESGITIMLVDEGLDTGPILAQRRLRLGAGATSGTLHDALAELGATVLLEVLPQLAAGSVRAEPQPAEGVMYAAKIDKAEALIDWRDSATALERKVRAFNPWPVAQTRWDGEPLRVLSAGAEPGGGRAAPGTIIAVRADAILVSCGQDCLAVTQLQRPGRKPVSARDFANAGLAVGTVLG
jgi:methionyl-tRNA formyltransferase